MRATPSFLFISILALLFFTLAFAAPLTIEDVIPIEAPSLSPLISYDPGCVVCEQFAEAPDTGMIIFMDELNHTFTVNVYYENYSANPVRQPIPDAMIVVYIFNAEGVSDVWSIYTDDRGQALFDFTAWSGSHANYRFLYCPFCCPGEGPDEWCGWHECISMSAIDAVGLLPEEVPVQGDVPDPKNCDIYKPTMQTVSYSPPPSREAVIPALCTIGMVIFAFLGGALHYSGKNPLGGFSIGSPRVGRHIRYSARGRGWYFSPAAAVSSIRTAARQGKRTATKDKSGKTVMKRPSIRETTVGLWGKSSRIGRIRSAIRGRYGSRGGGNVDTRGGMQTIMPGAGGGRGKEGRVSVDSSRLMRQAQAYLGGGSKAPYGRREKARAYGIFVAKQLGQLVTGLFDRSVLGSILGLNLEGRLSNWLSNTERESRANVIAAFERAHERGDVSMRVEQRDGEDVMINGEECTAITATFTVDGEQREGRIIVRAGDEEAVLRALAGGDAAGVNCLIEMPGTGEGQTIRYDLQNGSVVAVHQVFEQRDENGNISGENVMIYSMGSNGELSLTGAFVDGEQYRAEHGEAGIVDFYQAGAPESASPAFTAQKDAIVGADFSEAASAALATGLETTGGNVSDIGALGVGATQEIGRDGALSRSLLGEVQDQINDSSTLVTEYYREDLGQVRSERQGLYTDGLGSDDMTLTVIDSSASIDGEDRTRAIGNGTEIRVQDGRITSVTAPVTDKAGEVVPHPVSELPQMADSGSVNVVGGAITSVVGEDGERQRLRISADDLLSYEALTPTVLGDVGQALQHYSGVASREAVEELTTQYHPEARAAVDEAVTILAETPSIVPEKKGPQSREERRVTEYTREIIEHTAVGDRDRGSVEEQARSAASRALERTEPDLARSARVGAAAHTLGVPEEKGGGVSPLAAVRVLTGRPSLSDGEAQRALDSEVERAMEASPGVSREDARAMVERQLVDGLVDLARVDPDFQTAYEERVTAATSLFRDDSARASRYTDAFRQEQRVVDHSTYTDTAEALFHREHGANPLAGLGLRIADMSRDEAREALQASGVRGHALRSAMLGFGGIQREARSYARAAAAATSYGPGVGNRATSAVDSLMAFVPPAEALRTVIPQQKGEDAAAYGRRVEDFRRETAEDLAAALSHERSPADLATDEGRRHALLTCSSALVRALDRAAEEHGGRVVGYQMQRFYSRQAELYSTMAREATDFFSTGTTRTPPPPTPKGAIREERRLDVSAAYTAFIGASQVDAAGRMMRGVEAEKEGGRRDEEYRGRPMPPAIYNTVTDAIDQYLVGNLGGEKAVAGSDAEISHARAEGAIRLFEDASTRADRYVDSQAPSELRRIRRDDRRAARAADATLAATAGIGSDATPPTPPPREPTTDAEKGRVEAAKRSRRRTEEAMAELEIGTTMDKAAEESAARRRAAADRTTAVVDDLLRSEKKAAARREQEKKAARRRELPPGAGVGDEEKKRARRMRQRAEKAAALRREKAAKKAGARREKEPEKKSARRKRGPRRESEEET